MEEIGIMLTIRFKVPMFSCYGSEFGPLEQPSRPRCIILVQIDPKNGAQNKKRGNRVRIWVCDPDRGAV